MTPGRINAAIRMRQLAGNQAALDDVELEIDALEPELQGPAYAPSEALGAGPARPLW